MMQIKNYDHTQYLQFKSRYDLHYRNRVKFDYLSVNKIEFEEEINKVIQTMQDNNLNKLEILEVNPFQAFTLNLSNLSKLSFLKELYISGGIYLNKEKLENLTELEGLFLCINKDNKQTLNLARLVNLEYLEIINTTNKVKGFEKLPKLKTLILNKYSPKTKDFTEFDLPELVSLELVSPNIHSLDGFDKMPNILCFTLFRALKLANIDAISNLKKLEYLIIDHCKKIIDFGVLKNNQFLNSVAIENCESIKDVSFVLNLQHLDGIGLYGTTVLDYNLEPLKDLPYVSISNNSLYSYKCKEFKLHKKTGGIYV